MNRAERRRHDRHQRKRRPESALDDPEYRAFVEAHTLFSTGGCSNSAAHREAVNEAFIAVHVADDLAGRAWDDRSFLEDMVVAGGSIEWACGCTLSIGSITEDTYPAHVHLMVDETGEPQACLWEVHDAPLPAVGSMCCGEVVNPSWAAEPSWWSASSDSAGPSPR